jgi:hypothetical protein
MLRNVPFKIESSLARCWFRVAGMRPSSSPFVTGDSFRSIANHVLDGQVSFDSSRIKRGQIVFVETPCLSLFAQRHLPSITEPFVLITHNGDLNIDDSFSETAAHKRIVHWFAQNAVLKHPKVTAVPIGLENRHLHTNGVIRDFRRLAQGTSVKKARILYAFTVGTNRKERAPAWDALKACAIADGLQRVNSRAYLKTLAGYMTVASPPGNGIDCHRTWEALYLKTIPVVRRSPFYDSFPGLPVLPVDDWNEIRLWDEPFLNSSYEKLAPQIETTPYLHFGYWEARIRDACSEAAS